MIDVTGIDKVAFAKAVYSLSVPKGMGLLHAKHGDLDDATANGIVEVAKVRYGLCVRSCLQDAIAGGRRPLIGP